jgi:hypothetical protein
MGSKSGTRRSGTRKKTELLVAGRIQCQQQQRVGGKFSKQNKRTKQSKAKQHNSAQLSTAHFLTKVALISTKMISLFSTHVTFEINVTPKKACVLKRCKICNEQGRIYSIKFSRR